MAWEVWSSKPFFLKRDAQNWYDCRPAKNCTFVRCMWSLYDGQVALDFPISPAENHWRVGMQVLKYIKGTLEYGISYTKGNTLIGFCDLDWAEDVDGWTSVTSYYFSLGFGVVSWVSEKQLMVALSSTKAKYKLSCFASCEAVWLRRTLWDMGVV